MSTARPSAGIGRAWRDAAAAFPDAFAKGSGFTIERIDVDGRKILTDAELMTALGTEIRQSLLFVDADAARERLMQNPLVLQATVRKLYPHTLSVSITEREPFALWQRDETLAVIASDGTIIDGVEDGRFSNLPLIVGRGADISAKTILAAIARYPDLQDRVYAAVRVAGRRWNLRLKNGMDVKLPEQGLDLGARPVHGTRPHRQDHRSRHRGDRSALAEPRHRPPVRQAAAAEAEAKKADKSKRAGT